MTDSSSGDIQKYDTSFRASVPVAPKLPGISFIPEKTTSSSDGSSFREKCAVLGMVFGATAVVSWFVIVIGIMTSIAGVGCSLLGKGTSRAKYAQIGLYLSSLGGVLALVYMITIYFGLINYNYFTNEMWGIPSGGVQVLE